MRRATASSLSTEDSVYVACDDKKKRMTRTRAGKKAHLLFVVAATSLLTLAFLKGQSSRFEALKHEENTQHSQVDEKRAAEEIDQVGHRYTS